MAARAGAAAADHRQLAAVGAPDRHALGQSALRALAALRAPGAGGVEQPAALRRRDLTIAARAAVLEVGVDPQAERARRRSKHDRKRNSRETEAEDADPKQRRHQPQRQ